MNGLKSITNLLRTITLDRVLLVAVLTIQAGMAGWFYTYYTSQQKDRTQQADPALSSASLRPASTLQSRPATRPAQNSLTDQRTPFSLSGLHMPYEFSFAEQQGNYIRRQKETLRRRMQEQMQQSMMAFQQMRDSSKRGDAWKNDDEKVTPYCSGFRAPPSGAL